MQKHLRRTGRRRWPTCSLTVSAARLIRHSVLIGLFILLGYLPAKGEPVSLNLNEALRAALDHSFAVKSSEHLYEASRMTRQAAGAERFPTFSLEARAGYISDLVKIEILTNSLELGSNEVYQTDLILTMPIFTGGKITGAIDAAAAEMRARGNELEAARLETAWLCRRAYFGRLLSEQLVESAEASLKRIRTIREDVSHLYENGLADSVDILEAELAREKGRQALLAMESERTKASRVLAILLGLDPGTEFELTRQLASPESTVGTYLEYRPEIAAIERPELSALANRLTAAKSVIGINKAAWYPNLSAYAGYSAGKPNRNLFDADWDDYFTVGAALSWNFNFGGKTGRNSARAREEFKALQMSYSRLQENLLQAAELGLETLKNAYDSYRISQKEKELTEHKYRLGRIKQQAGEISVNRLVELEAELTAAEALYAASEISFYLAENDLLYAVGSSKIYGGAR